MARKASQSGSAALERRKRGFERASTLLQNRIRTGSESRGFAVSRLLTHWREIVGDAVADAARPVEVSYGRGFGATLTVLTTGARAALLEYEKENIKARVNACYGYSAISRVRITQTSPEGFAEGQVAFRNAEAVTRAAAPEVPEEVRSAANGVDNDELRAALERLGSLVLSGQKT